MTDRLDEIRARHAAATRGPWEPYSSGHGIDDHFYGFVRGEYLEGVGTINTGEGRRAEADLDLILNAHEDIGHLLAELDRVGAAAMQLRDAMIAQHEQVCHVLEVFASGEACPACEAAAQECDDDLACDQYREREREFLDAAPLHLPGFDELGLRREEVADDQD